MAEKTPIGSMTRVVLLIAILVLSACSRPPELIGIDNPRVPTRSVEGASQHKIFVATTRQRSSIPEQLYSEERSFDLGLASVTVSIPPNHQPGEIERASSLPPDPRRHFVAIDPEIFGQDRSFIAAIDWELAKRPPEDRDLLLMVHGYNNRLSDSVLRAAQFVEDSGFSGVTVLFSWASAGRPSRYVYDLNSVLMARPLLEEASALLVQTQATGFDVLAHSMGTLLLMEVMVQSDLRGNLGSSGKLKNVMLAAPDIDVDVFRSQMRQIKNNPGNVYVFISRDDRALGISRVISGGVKRVGLANAAELADPGITVIDVTSVSDAGEGTHFKYAGSPEVVQLIGQSLERDHFNDRSNALLLVNVEGGVVQLQELLEGG